MNEVLIWSKYPLSLHASISACRIDWNQAPADPCICMPMLIQVQIKTHHHHPSAFLKDYTGDWPLFPLPIKAYAAVLNQRPGSCTCRHARRLIGSATSRLATVSHLAAKKSACVLWPNNSKPLPNASTRNTRNPSPNSKSAATAARTKSCLKLSANTTTPKALELMLG